MNASWLNNSFRLLESIANTPSQGLRTMFLKLPKIDVGNDGFDEHDLLGRKSSAKQLTELVDRIEDPMEIALDGGWGTGKTFFLKLWVGEHRKLIGKATIIYFDAFAHDFLNDPLAGLVIRLNEERAAEDEKTKTTLREIKDAARKLAFPAARIGAAFASFGVSEAAAGAAQAIASELEGVAKDPWETEIARINAIENFKCGLYQLAQERTLVFVVDELDRCRPDYALSLLEIIKHVFEVHRVHFVLGANIDALKSSVAVRYGADMDAAHYLQKFISLTITLPDEGGLTPLRYLRGVRKKNGG